MAGAKGFFAGGLSLLRAYGEGLIWFSSYGGIHAIDVGRQHEGYLCDNTHLLAFTEGLRYQVRKLSGLKGLFLSGEGLVCEFQGHGRLWLQTRNPGALSAFLHPFRPVGGGHLAPPAGGPAQAFRGRPRRRAACLARPVLARRARRSETRSWISALATRAVPVVRHGPARRHCLPGGGLAKVVPPR